MAVQVSVIGSGADHEERAEEVGRLLAERGCTVVCGGLGEVMAAAARGAKSAGGTTIGILPGTSRADANEWIDHVVVTGPRPRAERGRRGIGRRRDRRRRLVRHAHRDRLRADLRAAGRDPRAGPRRRGRAARGDAGRGGRATCSRQSRTSGRVRHVGPPSPFESSVPSYVSTVDAGALEPPARLDVALERERRRAARARARSRPSSRTRPPGTSTISMPRASNSSTRRTGSSGRYATTRSSASGETSDIRCSTSPRPCRCGRSNDEHVRVGQRGADRRDAGVVRAVAASDEQRVVVEPEHVAAVGGRGRLHPRGDRDRRPPPARARALRPRRRAAPCRAAGGSRRRRPIRTGSYA